MNSNSNIIIFAILFVFTSLKVNAQDIFYIDKTVGANEPSSEYVEDKYTGGSTGFCDVGDEVWVEIENGNSVAASVDAEKVTYGKSGSQVRVKINWNACVSGQLIVHVYYKSRWGDKCIPFVGCPPTCHWSGTKYMYSYRIWREKSVSPLGRISGIDIKTSTSSTGVTEFKLTYTPGGQAKQIVFKNGNKGVFKVVPITRSGTSYLPTEIIYNLTGFGIYTLTTTVYDECNNPYPGPFIKLTVKPTCVVDNPYKVEISANVPEVPPEGHYKEGYEVLPNKKYLITVKNVTDLLANYDWTIDSKPSIQNPDVLFTGKSFTVLKTLGSYRIGLDPKSDRKGKHSTGLMMCTTPLNTMSIFVGGRDHSFADVCSIELPKDFGKLGFPDIDKKNIVLKHFAGNVTSQRTITVMPGITLEDGAEMFIETPVQPPDKDADMNFTEQILFDEYGRVAGGSRSYLNDNGMPLQTQYKSLSADVVLANATLYDAFGRPAISTLSAPVRSGKKITLQCEGDVKQETSQLDYTYKADFVKATETQAYNYTHFDLTKELAPLPVDNSTEGTLGWYYSTNNVNSTNLNFKEPLVATTQYPYSRTLFKHDGTGDVQGVTKPGDIFKAGSAYPFLATSTPEVVLEQDAYLVPYLAMRETELKLPKPPVIAGQFLKTVTTDETGKRSVTYTDKGGKALISLFFDVNGNTPVTKSYQFYDNAGRLVVSVSPNGLKQYNQGNFELIDKTSYFYNGKGLLVATEEKDGGKSKYAYRKDGKIRFSQNAEQFKALPQRYSYTNYDKAGRPIESGECTMTDSGIGFNSTAMKAILENVDADGGIPETAGIKTNRMFTYYDEPNYTLRNQRFVQGAVSYTKKDNTITTWYSYDERGRVEWMIQDIAGLDVKTIDYRYGYTGALQDVIYQKGKPDQFIHYYEYDKDGRLHKAYTTRLDLTYNKQGELTNPGILELQATYTYYLHGPLKRVELANKLQGIDYVYTIDGALKSINHADPAKDPGADGSNGVDADVFGMTFDYFNNDYTGAGYDAGSITSVNGSYTDQYGGLIKATRWHGPVEPGQQFGYAYAYDNRNQFLQADWGSVIGNVFTRVSLNPYKESIGGYDDNGNIRTLQRNATVNRLDADNVNLAIADFSYNYKAYTNKLENIAQGDTTFRSYVYNDLGQMTKETEGGKSKFVDYDVTGKVTAVFADEAHKQPITKFIYDDKGFRLSKTSYDTSYLPALCTWYVRDATGNVITTYEDDLTNTEPARPTEVPVYGSGKLGLYKPDFGITFYELTDHLGNVRAVIGKELTVTYTATMETELKDIEQNRYGFINLKTESRPIYNTTPDQVVEGITVVGDEVNRINNQPTPENNFTNNPIGVGKMVWVHPGDKIDAEVFVKYTNFSKNNTAPLAGLSGFLTKVFTSSAYIDGKSIFDVLNDPQAMTIAAASPLDEEQPRAFLNYILFDKNFKFVDCKSAQVTEDAELTATNQLPERLFFDDIEIVKEGFIYFYVSSLSNEAIEVYFDDLKITQTYSNVVAGGDFYPFGLAIKDRQIDRERYPYGYQGQFSEKDEETGWNHFELREYDAVIGRWTGFDPRRQFYSPYVSVGNNPITGFDPTGGTCPGCPDGVAYDDYKTSQMVFNYDAESGIVYNGEMITLEAWGSGQPPNIIDRILDFLPGERSNGTEILSSVGSNVQGRIKGVAGFVVNPMSEILYHKETSNKGNNTYSIRGDDPNKHLHSEFGVQGGFGVNYKRVIDTGDRIGHLDGTYKSDVEELSFSYYLIQLKWTWSKGETSFFYGLNYGAGIGGGVGISAEAYHGNVINFNK